MGQEEWTGEQEKKYEEICERFMHIQVYFMSFKQAMSGLKADKPKMYFCVVMGCLLIFAWLGSLVDNLFLTYFLVTILCLLPGLRHHGIIQKYLRGIWFVLKRLIFGKPKKEPKKAD
ncbi:ADP-ribosylation factor-like protein 6-interacting protein 1 [Liolophura sinensis]|uniref:ADP-ribosylation factor-like protein 6-interacting protein 1 n=1 Tax=Liolophura sinensis TaxID=3198878 RepID=UPI003159683D